MRDSRAFPYCQQSNYCWLRFFVSCLFCVALGCGEFVQNQPLREWSDSSGQFKVRANYAGRSEGGVALRREDGAEVIVPLERLSAADQEYVRKLTGLGTATPKAGAASPASRESFLIVQTSLNDKVVATAVGVVAFVDGERAYIAILDGLTGTRNTQSSSNPGDVKRVAIVGSEGKQRPVELEDLPFGERRYRGDISLSGPKNLLPPPIHLQSLPQVAVGEKFTYIGPSSTNWEQGEIKLIATESAVDQVLTSPTGEAVGFSVKGARTGVLVNNRDEIVALSRGDGFRSEVFPTILLQRALALQLQVLRIRETRTSPTEVKLEFLLQTRDPHVAIHSKQTLRLLLTHLPESKKDLTSHETLRDSSRFVIADGRWQKTNDGTELELQPAGKWDEEFDVPAPLSPKLNAAHWYGSYTFSLDKKLAPVFYQVVAVDAQTGKIAQKLDYDSHVKVPAEQPLPLLFKHPVNQYDAGVPILPKKPGGGRLLVADPLPESKPKQYPTGYTLPVPESVNTPLVAEVETHGTLAVARLNLATMPGPLPKDERRRSDEFELQQREGYRRRYRQNVAMVPSPDGKFLYVVDGREGMGKGPRLHKIDTATWSNVATLRLSEECRTIGLASGGLLVPGGESEFLIVDPNTLEIKKRWPMDNLQDYEIAAQPNLSTAYLMSGLGLVSFDTVAGQPVRNVLFPRLRSVSTFVTPENIPPPATLTLTLAPDGLQLFMANSRIHRLRVEGLNLIFEASGPPFDNSAGYRLSVDEKLRYAAVPTGKTDAANPTKFTIYDPKTLQPGPLSLDVGSDATAIAFDDANGRIFAASKARHVIQLDSGGKLVAECQLSPGEDIKRIVVVPNHGAAVYWGDVITVVDPDPKRLAGVPKPMK